ncbi:polymer-forming cytoskeletal protein [Accumulibacter sp.]|uniref:bactofilin family protein n=1 Tax=Accumulibacter sp. TaxID=2053492 RepID=UPI0025F9A2B3|nr:polymer-forming cytoskeletal protein [Accumulibacter sp.]MCP5230139.1 polymer-forming cytoskeletal protein [Accumulibacter sp.]
MFGSSRSGTPQNRIDSLVGTGTRVDGHLTFSGGLRVDGEVHGSISSDDAQPGTLVISEQARVEGKISVSHAVINGTVVGPIVATDSLELLPNARVTGDVEYQRIEIQLGAVVEGRLVHQAGTRTQELKLAANG